MPRLNQKTLDAIKPQSDRFFMWDDRLPGFGVRCYPTGRKVFVAQVRVGRGQRRVTIGEFGPFTVEAARKRAQEVIKAADEGRDPQQERREARQAMTVAELCDAYMVAARLGAVMTRFHRPKSPATVAIDEGRISRHIKPLIGSMTAGKLTRANVQLMADAIGAGKTAGTFKGKARGKAVVTGGIGTASRVVELLGGIWSWAEKRDHVSGASPTRGVDRVRGDPRDRVLSADELQRLGAAIAAAEPSMAAGALRLIALSGMRREEAVALRWAEIDALGQCLHLAATKTGRSTRPLGKPAFDMIAGMPRQADWLFPNRTMTGSADLKAEIATIFDKAGLPDARSHDLRRTFASAAADLGFGDATIAELLGHARRGVTERHYVRRSDPVMVAAADQVSGRIANMLGSKAAADVIRLTPTAINIAR